MTDCPQCDIRQTARAPRRRREQRYAQMLTTQGEAAMQVYRLAVIAEYRRIDALRGLNGASS
ncbi:hypothetical protein [Methylibium sp.]|uniref:hypothetical protein n=1 Tax=Methylibium sp. TaxID=2067992 RepID=UPI0017FAFCCA|nr:hypothetical protein [Methylibium sp.]MBA3591811.1 hypothetical protein [Methylibium sp.]